MNKECTRVERTKQMRQETHSPFGYIPARIIITIIVIYIKSNIQYIYTYIYKYELGEVTSHTTV